MSDRPKVADSPGLVWAPRKSGWVAEWHARTDLIKRGFLPQRARVWVARDHDTAIELRQIKVGLTNGSMVEVLDGLAPSDRVITRGSLFIDRVAAAATGS